MHACSLRECYVTAGTFPKPVKASQAEHVSGRGSYFRSGFDPEALLLHMKF